MTFFTNLNSWTKSLCLIAISKRIDLKRSAWHHFVDNKLYFHFLLNLSQFPFVKYVFHAFKDRTKSTESLQLTDYGDGVAISKQLQLQLSTPLLDRNVAKRRYITPKLFIVIRFFFFPLIDNLIKFCYKQRKSHQLKNSSLLLAINEYCMFHIEGFFSQQLFLYFISQLSFLHKLS